MEPKASAAAVKTGEDVTFTWTLSNDGSDANDLTATVTCEPELTGQTLYDTTGKAVAGSKVTIPKLEPDKPLTVELKGKAPSTNTVVACLELREKNTTNPAASGSASVTVNPNAALTLAAASGTAAAKAGGIVTVSWQATKTGTDPVFGAGVMVKPIAQGRIIEAWADSDTPVRPRALDGGVWVPLRDLNTTPTAHVKARVYVFPSAPATPIKVNAYARSDSTRRTEDQPVSLTVTRERTLRCTYEKTPAIVPGDTTEPTLLVFTVTNEGPSDCQDAAIDIQRPSAFTLRQATLNGEPTDVDQSKGTWKIARGLLPADGIAQIVADVEADPDLPAPTVSVPATLSSSETGTGTATSGSPDHPVTPRSDITLRLDTATRETQVGSDASYGFTIGNDGPSTAADLTLTVTLQAAGPTVTVKKENAPDFTIDTTKPTTTNLIWKGKLPPGDDRPLTIKATTGTAPGKITLTAKLTQKDATNNKETERARTQPITTTVTAKK